MAVPRVLAAQALVRIEEKGYANLVLPGLLKQLSNVRDRAFVSALVYGTTERQYTLDYLLSAHLSKPLSKMDKEVRAVLRSGLYQLLYMSVPPSAAVNQAVDTVKTLRKTSAAGLVNAVLRKAGGVRPESLEFDNELQRLSVMYSVSPAIAALIQHSYPEQCEAILAAFFERPATALRVNTLKTDSSSLAALLLEQQVETQPGFLPDSLLVKKAGNLVVGSAFQQGLYHIQGQASQLACHALQVQPGQRVLDLCAAPGGKSVTLCQMTGPSGHLTACDAAPNRLGLIQTALSRCGIQHAEVLCNDASVFSPQLGQFDRVLCDVPCSGLGILAKKPDIRLNDLKQLESLICLQKQILAAGARYLRPGGRLVYSTCTINPEENQAVVSDFLKQNSSFALTEVAGWPAKEKQENEMVTILPLMQNMDGFFVASLERMW